MTSRPNECALQSIEEEGSVRQISKAVMKCAVCQLIFDLPTVGNVPIHDYELFCVSARVSDWARCGLEISPRSVLVSHAVFQPLATTRRSGLVGGKQYSFAIFGMDL